MPDLSDPMARIRDLDARIRRLERPITLENASITDGRLRLIGGLLRVDSGGRVEIVGTLDVDGTTAISGPVTISGDLDITGDTTVSGDFEVLDGGRIRVGGVILTPVGGGRVEVGTSGIVIDAATKSITIPGTNPITITTDGAFAKIDLGVADLMSNGTQAGLFGGDYFAGVDDGHAAIGTSAVQFTVSGGALRLYGVGSAASAVGSITPLGIDGAGRIVEAATPA